MKLTVMVEGIGIKKRLINNSVINKMKSTDSRKGKGMIRRSPMTIFGEPVEFSYIMDTIFDQLSIRGLALTHINTGGPTLATHEEVKH